MMTAAHQFFKNLYFKNILSNFRMNIEDILEIYGKIFDRATHGGIQILKSAIEIFKYLHGNNK